MARARSAPPGATPAVAALVRAGIDHRLHAYDHEPGVTAFGQEAVAALGVDAQRVYKTLLVDLAGGGLAVAVLPVERRLDLKAAAAAFGAKKALLAEPADAERATGYVIGGISPFGQRRRLPTVLHEGALGHPSIFVSGGRRGLDIELAPADLVALLSARTAPITR